MFKRAKTGPQPFNVEYTLAVLKCKKRSLNDDERAAIAESVSIDTKFVRPTPEEVKATLEKITSTVPETEASSETPEEAKDL